MPRETGRAIKLSHCLTVFSDCWYKNRNGFRRVSLLKNSVMDAASERLATSVLEKVG